MEVGLNLTGRRRDGTEFPVEVSLSIVPDDEDGLAMAFVTDISGRIEQDRQMRHVEKLAALGSMAAGIAHELNNPVGIILSRLEVMLLEGEEQHLAPESVADLQVLHRHAQRLGHIAQSLLSFGRQRQLDHDAVDLAEIVEDALLFAGKHLSREGIHVLTTLDPGLPRVWGDATALEQVLMNLLLNARDAMPTGGTLRIETSLAPGPSGGGFAWWCPTRGAACPPTSWPGSQSPSSRPSRPAPASASPSAFGSSASTAQRSTSSPNQAAVRPSPSPFRHSRDAPPQPIFTRDASCRARRSGMALAASAVIERA